MKTNKMIHEAVDTKFEALSVSSGAGSTSQNYDMRGYDEALVAAAVRGNFTTVTIDLMQSSAATVAGSSAAGSKVGMTLGGASTNITTAGGVREMTLTFTTATTATDSFRLTAGGVTKTFTNINTTASLNSSAWTSTQLYYGSTVGSTANTGLSLRIDSLKTAINSTIGFGTGIHFSTVSTAVCRLSAASIDGPLAYNTTVAVPTAAVQLAVGGYDIKADQLTSTANKRYVALKISSAATACDVGVTVIRAGGHNKPSLFSGKLST